MLTPISGCLCSAAITHSFVPSPTHAYDTPVQKHTLQRIDDSFTCTTTLSPFPGAGGPEFSPVSGVTTHSQTQVPILPSKRCWMDDTQEQLFSVSSTRHFRTNKARATASYVTGKCLREKFADRSYLFVAGTCPATDSIHIMVASPPL